ncbi:glycosyltransferase family 1 protein [Burkholderia sp. MSMB1459WGS]|uniref:glycosyltransferase family 4 protein n=1 Tax=Burkholderia sp. MSMB1459WGS TaxID=1637970 RepID=UPI0009E9A56E|nr:glycosyltransferase family 1 protein [Burkholderia sp. MSMB1459WGS]
MRLTLAVDAIAPPLTGIGRYAWELASHYQAMRDEFDALRFFCSDRWVQDPARLLDSAADEILVRKRRFRLLRTPKSWRQWRLRREMRGHVFHSPNYFLPEQVDGGVVTVHDLSVFKYPETHPVERIRHFERSFASTLRRATHLITDSDATRTEVIDYFGWPSERVTAIGLGVRDTFRVRDASETGAALLEHGLVHGRYSLCVSTLEPRKRIDRLLNAYRDISMSLRLSYPLVLAGSKGWLSDALQEQIRLGEREGWLKYLGFADEAFLPLLYSGARAFLFPSIYEGFGLPVLEAMASGVPTLTSNHSSLPEVANGAAWLVEPNDHEALRDGIERALCDDAWRMGAVRRGLNVACTTTWDQCAKRTLEVCRRFA